MDGEFKMGYALSSGLKTSAVGLERTISCLQTMKKVKFKNLLLMTLNMIVIELYTPMIRRCSLLMGIMKLCTVLFIIFGKLMKVMKEIITKKK